MPKRKYWTRSQAKRALTETSINALPTEILQHIFMYVPFEELLAVRETCHFWQDAVGGCPALRDRFRLVLPHAVSYRIRVMHRGYKPPPAVPASTVAFKCDHFFKIGNIGSWWPQVAATITCLSFENCDFSVAILRHTPNLQSLELDGVHQSSEPRCEELDFGLNNLKKLKLNHSSLGQLSRMITQLKVLECNTYDRSATSMIEFVQSKLQGTLEDLILQAPITYLEEFTKLTGLGLKRLSLTPFYRSSEYGSLLLQFARIHPSIEDLTIADVFGDKVLYEVLRALPKLKRFNLKLREIGITRYPEFPQIPNVLPHLECLHIEWKTSYYTAISGPKLFIPSDLRLTKLRDLHLEGVTLTGDSLSNLLSNTPALHTMTLAECDFETWHQLLQIITQPKAMHHLKLTSFQVEDFEDEPFHCQQPHTSLRYLELSDCVGTPNVKVRELFHLFPQVTALCFGPKAVVDDGLVLEVCRTLTQLERLTVHHGFTTHASTVNVKWFCRNLKHFALYTQAWQLEEEDFDYFAKHLQSFFYMGLEVNGKITYSGLNCVIKAIEAELELQRQLQYESDSDD